MSRKLPVMKGIKINMSNHNKSDFIFNSLYKPSTNGAIPHKPNIAIVDHALNRSPPIYPK